MVVGVAATLSVRLAGIRWRIALPMFRPKDEGPNLELPRK
jgi:hypothetical protein